MSILRKGSKGSEVKQLQILLGITADGVFGVSTENAVKKFQKENNLTIDGIVGNQTLLLLKEKYNNKNTNNTTNTILDKNKISFAIYDPLNIHITKCKRNINYIVIHYTAGKSSAEGKAKTTKNVFINRSASADFVVDDKTIVQYNPSLSNYYCWAVGDKKNPYTGGGQLKNSVSNRNSVNIEICSNLETNANASAANHSGWYFTNDELILAAKLTAELMKLYNIDINHVIRHFDVTGKLCPGIVGWNTSNIYNKITGKYLNQKSTDEKWLQFKQLVLKNKNNN